VGISEQGLCLGIAPLDGQAFAEETFCECTEVVLRAEEPREAGLRPVRLGPFC
jgi:hypothetical protein